MLLWKLLRKNIAAGQLLGYLAATLIGLTIVLLSVRLYQDIRTVFSSEKGIFGRDFLVISKKVSVLRTLKIGSTEFDEKELENLQSQPFVKRMAGFTSASYQIYASVSIGLGGQFGTLLFFESVPDDFLDIKAQNWEWKPDSGFIPIILPKSYLALYNFGFAPGQGLPQLSEKSIGLLQLDIQISGKKQAVFQSRIVGFTDRINSILVPQGFMNWANTEFGIGTTPVSRVIVEPRNLTDPSIGDYFARNNYDVANEKAAAGEASSFLRTLIFVVIGIGGIITVLALSLMLLSIHLLIQKNHDTIENLSLLGYSVARIAFPYQVLVLALNGLVLLLSLLLVRCLQGYYRQYLGAVLSSDINGFDWILTLWGIGIVFALTLVSMIWIWLKLKEIRK